jgi:hypothetical protein
LELGRELTKLEFAAAAPQAPCSTMAKKEDPKARRLSLEKYIV